MRPDYPAAFDTIASWARTNRVTADEARKRFAQYTILRAITSSRALSDLLVFKGGNALDFVWHPNRSTTDLDFSADMDAVLRLDPAWNPVALKDYLQTRLTAGLGTSTRLFGVVLAIHSFRQQPPKPDSTFITYEARVGYAMPDEQKLRKRLAQGGASANVIPLDISLNEPICADERIDLRGQQRLRVCTIEDIVAEKLRALLQQPLRNRTREQDLLDIAVILRAHPGFDGVRVAAYLLRKAAARNVPVSRRAFHDPRVISLAQQDYAALAQTTRTSFIPFGEALASLHTFVAALAIPADTPPEPQQPA